MMKSRFLIAHKYKPLGWFLFISGLVLGVILMLNEYEFPELMTNVYSLTGADDFGFNGTPKNDSKWIQNNVSDEIASVLIIIGGILVSFSRTKDEDEYISKIRSESLVWATYVNYGILLFAVLFIFDGDFFNVMIYNMFTILLFFIVRFHYVLYKTKKVIKDEE